MKRLLRITFINRIRAKKFFQASLVKHFYALVGVSFSIIWLFVYGADLVFEKGVLPYVKVSTIIIGYGIPLTNVYFERKFLLLKKEKHDIRREKRNSA